MWWMKIGTNLSREGVLAFEDAGFQVHQREALSPCCRLSKITSPTHPVVTFLCPTKPTYLPNFHIFENHASTFNNTNRNLQKQVGEHQPYGRELCYWVTAISYVGFGVVINIVSKEDKPYYVQLATCHNAQTLTHQNILSGFGKEREMGVIQILLLCVQIST